MKVKVYVEFLPLGLIVLGALIGFYSLMGFFVGQNLTSSIIGLAIAVILVTTHQGATIDAARKTYADYYWVLGLKLQNSRQKFARLDTVLLSQTGYVQGYGFFPRLYNEGQLYQGYLKFTDQESLYLGRNKSKKKMQAKLNEIARRLNISLTDATQDK